MVQDERTVRVSVSRAQLTVLVFPASVMQAVTSAPGLELKTSDRHVIVSPPDRPVDLVVTTTQYVYVLMLEPENKPADTVVIEDVRVASAGGTRGAVGRAAGYEDEMLELVRAVATGQWPAGAMPRQLPPDAVPRWTDLEAEQRLGATVRRSGGLYELRRLVLRNTQARARSFREQEFYTGEEFAIALSRQVIEPGERVVVSVVLPGKEIVAEPDPLERLDPDPAGRRAP